MASAWNLSQVFMIGVLYMIALLPPIQARNLNGNFSAQGLRFELTHWASHDSPLAAEYPTLHQRMRFAVKQSHLRMQAFKDYVDGSTSSYDSYTSNLSPFGGGYVMDIMLGSPSQSFKAIADTGSDLVWLQAYPCTSCGSTIFYPSKSSSYKPINCDSSLCSELRRSTCGSSSSCRYTYSYGSGQTSGQLVTDMLSLSSTSGSTEQFPSFVFGNGYSNYGFRSFQGIIGLGQGPLSLTSQLSDTISKKFLYCLVDIKSSSESSPLLFGPAATISSSNIQSTPIVPSSIYPTYYIINIQSLLLNGKSYGSPGTTIIDSGTTLTYLPSSMYSSLLTAFMNAIDLPSAFSETGLDLCYDKSSNTNYKFPSLAIQFNGATLTPPSSNYFISFDEDTNIVCLAMASNEGLPVSILGNVMQQNYQVLYDRGNSVISFAPANCASM